MATYESNLIFKGYIVDEVIFKRNEKYKNEENEKHRITFKINKTKLINGNEMIIKLYTTVFENASDNNYPFEISVTITGYFDISKNDMNIDFEPNAIAILYPYVRAIISIYTTNSNIGPIILPTINVIEMLKQENKDNKEEKEEKAH